MKNGVQLHKSRIIRHSETEGQSLEEFLREAMRTKQPIEGGAHISYTERKDGVLPQYDIRTDRFTYAMRATDRIHMSEYARRQAEDFPKEDNQTQES